MPVNYSTAVRIAMLDAIETVVGANARLIFYTGTKPALCSDAPTGDVVATLALTGNSGDWLSAASAAGNVVTKTKHPRRHRRLPVLLGGVLLCRVLLGWVLGCSRAAVQQVVLPPASICPHAA